MKLEFKKMLSTKLILCVQQIRMLNGNVRKLALETYKKRVCLAELGQNFKETYGDLLKQSKNISNETWVNMREYLIESNLSPMIVDAVILDTLAEEKYVDSGLSYYNFLKTNNYDISTPILLKYLHLYSLKESLSETEKAYIFTSCKNLMETYPSLDNISTNRMVQIFCNIDEWEHAIKIIKMFETNDKSFLRTAYSHVIEYLFIHGHRKLGYEYLTLSMKNDVGPKDEAYIAYLEYCLKDKDTFTENVEKLFKMWNTYGIKPSVYVVRKYMTACNKFGWHATLTTISSLTCETCKQKLSEKLLTEKEISRLLIVVKGFLLKNMYSATKPEEMKHFIAFIGANKPFDIVIDGLNFVHCSGFGYKSLKTFLELYKQRRKKILVIGRKHMQKVLRTQGLNNLAHYFLVENWSKDDLFLLYAALSSGANCKVVSEDFMRNHKFALQDPELDTLFHKWQMSQQYLLYDDLTMSNSVMIKPLDSIVHKGNNCWHIPHVNNDHQPRKRHITDTDWACFNMCQICAK